MCSTLENRISGAQAGLSSDVICIIDSQHIFRRVSAACRKVLGYGGPELVGRPFADIVHPDDRSTVLETCEDAYQQAEPVGFDCRCLSQTGQELIMAWSAFRSPTDDLLICVGRELKETSQLTQQARGEAALHHALIEHGFDMVALLDENGMYTYVGGSTPKIMGYKPEQLLGRNAFDFIHPDDVARVQSYWHQLSLSPESVVNVPDFRHRNLAGEWKWIETTASNQIQDPSIGAYVLSSRDITERKENDAVLAESEQRMRLLFENNPALAVFQCTKGLILDANPAFLSFFHKQKHEVVNRQVVDFVPEELRSLFDDKFQEALAGHSGHFPVTLPDAEGEEKTLSMRSIPLVVEDKIIGVHVMAKDITEASRSQRLIKQQAQQLTAILESITDAFFSLDKDSNLIYINGETERLLNISREEWFGKNIWDIFPGGVNSVPYQRSQQALETGNTEHFETFFENTSRWLDVKIFPSQDGLAVYFSDITDRAETERQQKLLALVAQGTDNGVVITDAHGRTEWVNAGFTKHTGYTMAEMLGKKPGDVLQGPETDPAAIQRIRERLKLQTAFSATILNYKKSGQKLWYAMDITPIVDDAGQITQYVAIQQNINYRKEIEANQAKMTQDLYRHNRDLQQFTYVISHNLRAPLANGLGLSTLLTKVDRNSEAFTISLAHLRKSMVQVDTVLRDLNMMLSIRDKQDVVTHELVSLPQVCTQAIEDLAELLERCGGQVNLDMEPTLMVPGNRAYFYSIFYNLLSNSIKYRSEARKLKVDVKCYIGEHGGQDITFTDNGSGFDMHKAGSDIFQLYKRFHTNQRGRGIGLFLIKTHVEAMGGKIEVASDVNFGTRFLIHLDKS